MRAGFSMADVASMFWDRFLDEVEVAVQLRADLRADTDLDPQVE